ncbi:MAG TPA: iron-sulfur cluster assembly scaffold protein [Thermotogota bacterium]|jgi:nitrogen fixation NifU-like protein|nr:iron-sulfur cluster assembly scaffold protein [Thermotogota bacterium]NLZ12642.1 iron-sulfur cluster assembly scaffold protein [Thermotogaceae bacterium]MDD8040035.1 iron-sulfur cluster assembly scaffold protein [Thermotogota bacterium]MDD8052466.1 iron-sulfur cluster assembly scaffold protein [Thermotogota bacterium]HNR63814.1 iron-sulfur cluster assembly scaffold protein [Thermotogota bacterium]
MINKYSPLLTEHFMNPRNIGRLNDFTFSVESDHLKDGDRIVFYVALEDGRIKDISYTIQGCPRVIASSSYTSELVKGKKISEVLEMKEETIAERLGIDDPSFNCIRLPLSTLQQKLKEYL